MSFYLVSIILKVDEFRQLTFRVRNPDFEDRYTWHCTHSVECIFIQSDYSFQCMAREYLPLTLFVRLRLSDHHRYRHYYGCSSARLQLTQQAHRKFKLRYLLGVRGIYVSSCEVLAYKLREDIPEDYMLRLHTVKLQISSRYTAQVFLKFDTIDLISDILHRGY